MLLEGKKIREEILVLYCLSKTIYFVFKIIFLSNLIEILIGKQQNNTDSKPWLDSISGSYRYSSYLDINKTQCLGGEKIKDTLYI